MLDAYPEGWFVGIERSLTRAILVGGVPFGFAVMNGTFTLALVLGAQKVWSPIRCTHACHCDGGL